MAKRKTIPNSVRFEVFKRDSFKCQYCGASAPEVVLNLEHIKPVSKGGDNDITNLVTACFTCNSGKSDRELSDESVAAKQKKQLDELNERRQQLEMLMEWKLALGDKSYEADKVMEYFNTLNSTGFTLTDVGAAQVKRHLLAHGLNDVLKAIDEVTTKYHYLEPGARWDKLGTALKYKDASEDTKKKAYVLGIIKNRWGAFRLNDASNLIDRCMEYDIDLDKLIALTKTDRSWRAWEDSMYDFIDQNKADKEDF